MPSSTTISRLLVLLPFLVPIIVELASPGSAHAQSGIFRTRLGVSGGVTIPIETEGFYSDPGSSWQAQIGVGDDHSVVGIVVGYTSFGGHLFENRVASVTEFELRSEWCMRPQSTMSPLGQIGVGLYRVADPTQGERRAGFRAGAGIRWAPEWHTAVALVATFSAVMDRGEGPHRWAGLSLELLRWVD